MAAGQYQQAAALFDQLGQGAERLGRPQQAANLRAQAGLAWAEAGDQVAALAAGRAALKGFLALNMQPRFGNYLRLLSSTLQARGLDAAASQLQAEFGGDLPLSAPQAQPAVPSRPRLPTVCPQCGAPVRSDEVEWIDDFSAACAFCGGVVQGD